MSDELESNLTIAVGRLSVARRVVALTGAGVSAESGVPTFRGMGGLWEGHPIEDVATPRGFARNPTLVWRFYNARRAGLRDIQPNPGHFALADLERRFGEGFSIVTQNVDGLHAVAGNTRIVELHGNLRRVKCSRCDFKAERGLEELPDDPPCPVCQELLRPDIVWFGEMLDPENWSQAAMRVATCDVLLVVGTSQAVYPAASLVPAARQVGATVIEVNPEPSGALTSDMILLQGPSGAVLPRLVERLGEVRPASS